MGMALSDTELERIVRSLVAGRLERNKVREVRIMRALDHDGDPVVRIRVVTSGDPSKEATRLVGLTGELRNQMEGDDAFPILSYMSASDSKWLDAQPA